MVFVPRTTSAIPNDATCLNCGYCLLGLRRQRCPECGQLFNPRNHYTFGPQRRRRWRQGGAGFAFLAYLFWLLSLAGAVGLLFLVILHEFPCTLVGLSYSFALWGVLVVIMVFVFVAICRVILATRLP